MDEENGGIRLFPGSHKVETLLSAEQLQELDLNTAITPSLDPGDTLCMNQLLVHYSLSNQSEDTRLILIDGFSVIGANHGIYPGEGSAETIDLY